MKKDSWQTNKAKEAIEEFKEAMCNEHCIEDRIEFLENALLGIIKLIDLREENE